MAKKPTNSTIELTRLVETTSVIPIDGLTPIIPHKWSEKAKRMMPGHPDRDSVKGKKEQRKPEEEATACLYTFKKGKKIVLGMPATAFKAAMVGACRFFDKPSMVEAKQMLFVEPDGFDDEGTPLVEIVAGSKTLREDTPRLPGGTSDLRYRYCLSDWTASLRVTFVPMIITTNSVMSLVDAAGRGGIGDWRPSAPKSMTGTFGTWRVSDTAFEDAD